MPAGTRAASRALTLSALAAAAAAFLLYLPTASNGFVFDDINVVQRNPLASDPGDLRGIFGSHYWQNVHEGGDLYRPLTILSFAINHALTGAGAAGYHVTNALLHGLVSALVVMLGAALGLGGGGALAAGLLFAVHAVHVEAVAPVVGRSELLAALFVIAGWLCHLKAAGPPGGDRAARTTPTSRSGPPGGDRSARPPSASGTEPHAANSILPALRHALRAAAAVLFAAGLLSKEHAAVLPALVLAGDLFLHGRRGWRSALPTLAWMVPAGLAVLGARMAIVPGLPPEDPLGSVFGGIGTATRVLTATGVLGRYLGLLVFPLTLSADYSYHQIPLITSALDPLFLGPAAACGLLLALGLWSARRGGITGAGLLFYLLALLPVSNIPVSIGTVMGERLLYLPSAGLCIAAAALVAPIQGARLSRALRGLGVTALALVCALHSARVLTRIPDWKDQLSLFTATVAASPRSAKAWYNLGATHDDLGNYREAMAAYERALEIQPAMAQPHRNLGLDLLRADRPAEALTHLQEAARLDPAIVDVFSDAGIALFGLGRLEEAQQAFLEEIARRPVNARPHYNLGVVLLEAGRPAEAVEPLRKGVSLAPADPEASVRLGLALARSGRHGEALAALERAFGLDPSSGEALLELARIAEGAGDAEVAARARFRAGASNQGATER